MDIVPATEWDCFILFVRLSDFWKPHPEVQLARDFDPTPETTRRAIELKQMLEERRPGSPSLVIVCPDNCNYQNQEALFLSIFDTCSNVHLYTAKDVVGLYHHEYDPIDFYNAERDLMMHDPFSTEFYMLLSVFIVRKSCKFQRKRKKVLVLDCDNTLWKGECGVDAEIELTPPYLAIQSFALEQMKKGLILCLCSKNIRQDVIRAFQNKMLLDFESHITIAKVSWDLKSIAIRELADELGLGLDSFIFIDDSPAECQEVKSNCPDVTVLHLPSNPDEFQAFLQHAWVFDTSNTAPVTTVDRLRTEMYKANVLRQKAAKEYTSSDAFLASLGVEIQIERMSWNQIDRVVQLTQRTNQFNTTCWRMTREEVEEFNNDQRWIYTVSVTDRFGHFGLVGLIFLDTSESKATVPLFLLSCRVLNRKVEDEMWQFLQNRVRELNFEAIDLKFIKTERNIPAQLFFSTTATKTFRLDDMSSKSEDVLIVVEILNAGTHSATKAKLDFCPKYPIHRFELVKTQLESILPVEKDMILMEDRFKFRRKARHRAKVALEQPIIWSATGNHIGIETKPKPVCKTPTCTRGRSLECTLTRCRLCCYRIQRIIKRMQHTNDLRSRKNAQLELEKDYDMVQIDGQTFQTCILHNKERSQAGAGSPLIA